MSEEVYRNLKAVLCIFILAGAEVRNVRQKTRFSIGPYSKSGAAPTRDSSVSVKNGAGEEVADAGLNIHGKDILIAAFASIIVSGLFSSELEESPHFSADLEQLTLGKGGHTPNRHDSAHDDDRVTDAVLSKVDGTGLDRLEDGNLNVAIDRPSGIVFTSVALACLSPLLFGYAIAFTSPAQGTMQGTEHAPNGLHVFSENTMQWYASLINIGCVAGAFGGSVVSDRFGRKVGLACAAVPQIIGWAGHCVASQAVLLVILRLLLGFGVGMGSAITPVYIGEVATTSIRGSLGACNQLSITIGIFLANLLGTAAFQEHSDGQTYHNWRGLTAVGTALSIALLFAMFTPLTPETPSWMARRGDLDGTIRAVKRLRRGPESSKEVEARELMRTAKYGMETATHGRLATAGSGFHRYRKSYIIALGLLLFQQFSGVNAIMMYTAQIFEQAGMGNPTLAAMVSMLGQVGFTFVSCLLMERAGRRGLLLFGSACMGVSHCMMAYYFLASQLGIWGPSWLALCGIGTFLLGFSLGMGPIPWLIMAEIVPTEARGSLSAIGTALNWASSFVVTLVFKSLGDALTKQGVFILFASICWLSFIFVSAVLPETKGKSVEEVIEILARGQKVPQASPSAM